MVPLSLHMVSKRFGSTVAVDTVDLQINTGELFFLLGPSGCGKTTLLRIIAGLAEPTSGAVRFGDRDVTHVPTGRRRAAMVFQSYALWPHMTVAQNISFGLEVRKVPPEERRRRTEQVLKLVQMARLGDRRPAQLSGGQQQRVALARALVVQPEVLLLDEPLSNLDARLRMEMRSEIRRICKQSGITTVYVTHDQEEALSMADRIAVMDQGRLCQVGTPRQLYTRPANRFVAGFLGATNFISAVVQARVSDQLEMESAAGSLCSTVFPQDVPARGNVTCCVRPEAIRLVDAPASGSTPVNTFNARHIDTIYMGDSARHVFELADGEQMQVNEVKPRPRDWSAATACLEFDPGDVVVLTN